MRLTCHSVQQFMLMNQGHMNQEAFHAVTYSLHIVRPALKMEHWKDTLQSPLIHLLIFLKLTDAFENTCNLLLR